MSGQDVPSQLCREANQHLTQEEFSLAAAFFMAAFSCNAPIALQRVKSLDDEQHQEMINTLEKWCLGDAEIPKIKCDGMAIVSLNPGIAAVFLSTICPNNIASSLFKMGTFLRTGRYEDVVSRCNSLLNTHPQHSSKLLLTRGLAWILSQTYSRNGVVDYIQVFTKYKDEARQYICTKQREYLPQVIRAFHDYISSYENNNTEGNIKVVLHDCYSFLAALAPDDLQICKTQAAYLFEECKFEECIAVYSRAIEALSLETKIKEEKISCLLVDRAAAYYSLGCRTKEMVQDLAQAFRVSPAHARKRFTEIFSSADVARVMERSKACIEMEFGDFREAVRAHTELRSDIGTDLLLPIMQALQFLIQCCPESRREMNIRLADCKLLAGDFRTCLDICNQLINSEKKTYQNTLYVLRGFCLFHLNEHQQALKDFQNIIEDESPHPSSCIKALCGRGLVRMVSGSTYLTALDYITACKLKLDETFLTTKTYVPWNQRGLLYKVLQEEGEKVLQKKPSGDSGRNLSRKKTGEKDGASSKECDVSGVHQLAMLLMMLDPTDDLCRILCTDALYQMDRIEEAHKMLSLALNSSSQRSPVLARLALLQLKKGFIYDGNQLIKKVIQLGDTSCLLPIMDIFIEEDRRLMRSHCHAKGMSILQSRQGEDYLKEAVAYLSFAIIASGGHAKDSLLARGRCYGQLGQKKTAIFDFNTMLKEEPDNVEALCAKGFMQMSMNQQKEAVGCVTLALRSDAAYVAREMCALKPEAQLLITDWLHDHCRTSLEETLNADKSFQDDPAGRDLELITTALIHMEDAQAKSHLLYIDMLIAKGNHEEAFTHLKKSFTNSAIDESAKARYGILHVKCRNVLAAAQELSTLAGKNPKELESLVKFLDKRQRQSLSQIAGQEGNSLLQENRHEKALEYFSLAVIASNNNPKYLRLRASCLTHLGNYNGAVSDMDMAIQRHSANDLRTQVEDFCFKGHVLLLEGEEEASCRQYVKAVSLDSTFALAAISDSPGRTRLVQIFSHTAHKYFEQKLFEESWKFTECGLIIDENSQELRKLKARIKREASGCIMH
ncbi:PREDICTED: tetratricopeptide repeat protein 34 [Nanorana parkeri]|uniref:tetratricopeptide repeat protein 34 n=1 Tax=Nanorana parkeri TaxID=125878 RepID=UPI000854B043|nr:PREDICTED: tetratricopeptide repeat protein 34 [Nanorana parkeri]